MEVVSGGVNIQGRVISCPSESTVAEAAGCRDGDEMVDVVPPMAPISTLPRLRLHGHGGRRSVHE